MSRTACDGVGRTRRASGGAGGTPVAWAGPQQVAGAVAQAQQVPVPELMAAASTGRSHSTKRCMVAGERAVRNRVGVGAQIILC